jgi:hypothetical protein
VHDRTVDGKVKVFGNQGALFMNAMTWWDHETESVWSQPWGRAIVGPLQGTELELLPSELVPWGTWREAHPETLALSRQALSVYPGSSFGRARFHTYYVIGVTLGKDATAFPYQLAAETQIINDSVGTNPVVVHVDPAKSQVHVYLRQVTGRQLTFVLQDGTVRDEETGSTWEMSNGLAIDGPLQGQALRTVPYVPAYPSAWEDFYPESRWYEAPP